MAGSLPNSVSHADGYTAAAIPRPSVSAKAIAAPVQATRNARALSPAPMLVPTIAGRYTQTAAIEMPVPMSRINAIDLDGDTLTDLILLGEGNRAFVMFQSAAARGTFGAPRQL